MSLKDNQGYNRTFLAIFIIGVVFLASPYHVVDGQTQSVTINEIEIQFVMDNGEVIDLTLEEDLLEILFPLMMVF